MANTAQLWRGSGGLAEREREIFQNALALALDAHEVGPWAMTPNALRGKLREIVREADPWQVWEILGDLGWDSGYAGNLSDERMRAVQESRRLFRRSPLHQWSVWLWTGWALGDAVSVSVKGDDAASEVVRAFWLADRNAAMFGADRINEMSDWLLNDGNTFLAFYGSRQDGETMSSELDTDEITAIVTHPQNSLKPLFYKRQFTVNSRQETWYYPDWQVFFSGELDEPYPGDEDGRTLAQVVLPRGVRRADTGHIVDGVEDNEQLGDVDAIGTSVCVYHMAHNRKERGSLWGWPLATVSWPWLGAHKKWTESRLTVAEGKAMFVRRKKVTGGSRGVGKVRNTIASNVNRSQLYDTNPPATAASTEIDNAMVETTDLPMTTGAGDARVDNMLFSWMPLLGEGLFPTSAGLDTARWATALEMDKAQSMMFERYRAFWSTQLKRMAKIPLLMKEKFGHAKFASDLTIEVSVDAFSLSDFPGVAKAVGALTRDMLVPFVESGVLDVGAARELLAALWRINLQALGVSGAETMASDEAFGVVEERTDADVTTVERIAAVIAQNAENGAIDWAEAAEWAFEELRVDNEETTG